VHGRRSSTQLEGLQARWICRARAKTPEWIVSEWADDCPGLDRALHRRASHDVLIEPCLFADVHSVPSIVATTTRKSYLRQQLEAQHHKTELVQLSIVLMEAWTSKC
jgi:hypothetical protein